MCGRFTNMMSWRKLHSTYRAFLDSGSKQGKSWNGKINIAPTTDIPVLFLKDGARTFEMMRWGLIPAWSKEIGKFATFNARADGVDSKPAYRGAWKAQRRCIIPADSFFEWRKSDKQPFAIGLGNKGPMAFAGLWEEWRPKDAPPITSCTMITTEANALMGDIHPRMPVILGEENWDAWLDAEKISANDAKDLLTSFPAERMSAWPVSKAVGNVRNQGSELIEEDRPASLSL